MAMTKEYYVLQDENGKAWAYRSGSEGYVLIDDEQVTHNEMEEMEPLEQYEIETEESDDVPSIKFSHNAVLLLLHEYEKRKEKFRNKCIKNKKLWMEIADVLCAEGCIVTREDVDRKFRNLKRHYLKIKDHNAGTGRSRLTWPYYTRMEEIFAYDETVNTSLKQISTLHTVDTSLLDTDSTTERDIPKKRPLKENQPESDPNDVPPVGENIKQPCIKKRRRKEVPEWVKDMSIAQNEQKNAICRLEMSLEKSNAIQEKRNEILEKLLEKL